MLKKPNLGGRRQTQALVVVSTQISIMFICLTLAVSLAPQDAEAIVWESVQEISIDAATEDQYYPMIVADRDKAHVVWTEATGGGYDVIYRVFDGTTWGVQWEVSTDVGNEHQFNPSIAVYGDKRHVVWYEWPGFAGDWPDVYHRYYDGTTWWNDGPIAIDVGTWFDRSPSVAAYENKAHVVWQDYTDGDADIYYSYFNGIGWVNTQELSTDSGAENQKLTSMGIDRDKVHVVWQDQGDGDADIYHRYYNGTSWEPEEEISIDVGTEHQCYPSIAVQGNELHVAWYVMRGAEGDIIYRHFNGTAWQPEMEISSDSAMEGQYNPSIAVDDGYVYVVWQDYEDGDSDIFLRYFNGTDWQPEMEISEDLGSEDQEFPTVAADDGNVHIVWENHLSDMDIYYRRGIEDLVLPESNAKQISPYWLTNSTFNVEWAATDNYSLANISLLYRYSPDNSSWSGWSIWAWNNSISGVSASGSFSFQTNSDGYYEFYTIARDIAGNEESPPVAPDAIAAVATIPRPPTNLSARLWGANSEHVYLEWNTSLDDGGGRKNVVAYQVFKGTVFDAAGVGYSPQGLHVAPLQDDFDNWSGEGDSNNYFYYVCVYTNFLKSSCTVTQAAKFTRSLSKGPNLISIPLIQSQEGIETVLQTVEFDKAWSYDSSSKDWKSYMTFKPYGGYLESVDHRRALWVNVTSPSNLTVAGIVPWTTQIQLYTGWNLVGFPSFNVSYTVGVLKTDTGAARVEGFNPSAPPYFLNVLTNGDTLGTGYGYWMYSQNDGTWTIQNS